MYMSPEFILRLPYNPEKNDVFACGVILFMMVTGRPPFFEKASVNDPLYKFFVERREERFWKYFLKKITTKLSEEFIQLINGMLCFDPKSRMDF